MAGEFYRLLIEAAKAHGFSLSGAVDLDLVDFSSHTSRYDEWLSRGYAGQMEYLKRGRDRRANPRLLLPSAESVFCVAVPYDVTPAGAADSKTGPRYARYVQGRDYHLEIKERLERLTQTLHLKVGTTFEHKVCVDTSAVLERSWASLVGLGWIGKNSLLIHPKHGSYIFLGVVLFSEKTGEGPKPIPNFCGNCSRCLSACPTGAFESPGMLNSEKCISYWTLEKRGELALTESQKSKIGPWVAGCDICQEVCPFNQKPSRAAGPNQLVHDWARLLRETPEQYQARVKDSALSRVKPEQFRRNLAIALTNALEENPELGAELRATLDAETLTNWQALFSESQSVQGQRL